MSIQAARLIGSAIVTAGALLAIAIGSLPQAGDEGGRWGSIALLFGGLFFIADWLKSWWADQDRGTSSPNEGG